MGELGGEVWLGALATLETNCRQQVKPGMREIKVVVFLIFLVWISEYFYPLLRYIINFFNCCNILCLILIFISAHKSNISRTLVFMIYLSPKQAKYAFIIKVKNKCYTLFHIDCSAYSKPTLFVMLELNFTHNSW